MTFFLPRFASSRFRCHPQHATGPAASGGDGVEANPAPPRHRPGYLPAASRKSLYLEERVLGSDGEVRKWSIS